MSHIRRSSDLKLHKREVTIHLHDTSFSPSHELREDLCCGGSRRINPGLDSNTFVSGMTTSFKLQKKNLQKTKQLNQWEFHYNIKKPRNINRKYETLILKHLEQKWKMKNILKFIKKQKMEIEA